MRNFISAIFFIVVLITSISLPGVGQPADSTSNEYYSDHSEMLLIRLYTLTKLNTFTIIREPQSYVLAPNGQTNIGIGFNYKSFGLGVSFGLPKSKGSDEIYGTTSRFDIQGSVYSKNFGGDAFVQGYKGYYNSNPNDFVDWQKEEFPQLPDMQVFTIGLTAFYIQNGENYSFRAANIRNQIQNKSAGSFTYGVFGNYDASTTDNGYIPSELADSTNTSFDLKAFEALSVGVSLGYFYTLVKNRFFVNMGVVPGFGFRRVHLKDLMDASEVENTPAGQVLVRTSMGYEHKSFYLGFTGSVNFRNFKYKEFEFDLGTEQFRFILGKRFLVL